MTRASLALLWIAMIALLSPVSLAQSKKMRDVLPAPTGEHQVGRTTYYWPDDSTARQAGERPRPLRVDLWYPAEIDDKATKAAYCHDLKAIKSKMGLEAVGQDSIATHAYVDPPLVKSPLHLAVLLLSPGYSTNANQYTALAEELASHGYLVATVDHPWQSAAIAFPDGRVIAFKDAGEPKNEPYDPELGYKHYRERVDVRVGDLQRVLEHLTALNAGEGGTQLENRLDLDRVGVVGHSLGGVAAPSLCMKDDRVKAAVNLDGHARSLPMIPDVQGRGPRQPFMELTDPPKPPTISDEQLAKFNKTRAEFEQRVAEQAQQLETLMRSVAGGSYRVTIPGTTHQSFSDSVLWIAANPKDHQRRTQIIRDYVRAFFDKHLRQQQGTVLDAEKGPYAEVTIERFEPQPAVCK